jgi:hypothetical protein
LAAVAASAEVKRYDGQVELKPDSRDISGDLTLTIAAGQTPLSSARFYMNKNLRIESLTCPICDVNGFTVSTTDHYQFMIDSEAVKASFLRPLAPGETIRIRIRYSGKIPTDPGPSIYTREWVELAVYAGWFPYDSDSNNFTYDISVKLPSSYKVASSAAVSGGNGEWHLQQKLPTMDINLIASGDLKRRVIERDGLSVGLDYVDMDEKNLDRLFVDIRSTLELYTKWYGHASTGSLELVISQRPGGGAYARVGLISYPMYSYKQNSQDDILQAWGHEVAHLWWHGAPGTWENWLDESFAEYSSWRLLRTMRGETAFENKIEWARRQCAGKPPVWGTERQSRDGYVVLYFKGALCLYELEKMLGTEKFEAFTGELYAKNIKSTSGLLELLQQRSTSKIREHFEALLKE